MYTLKDVALAVLALRTDCPTRVALGHKPQLVADVVPLWQLLNPGALPADAVPGLNVELGAVCDCDYAGFARMFLCSHGDDPESPVRDAVEPHKMHYGEWYVIVCSENDRVIARKYGYGVQFIRQTLSRVWQ